jgi:hypothetical protein
MMMLLPFYGGIMNVYWIAGLSMLVRRSRQATFHALFQNRSCSVAQGTSRTYVSRREVRIRIALRYPTTSRSCCSVQAEFGVR